MAKKNDIISERGAAPVIVDPVIVDPDVRSLVYVNDDGTLSEIKFKLKSVFSPAFRLSIRKFDVEYTKSKLKFDKELKAMRDDTPKTEATIKMEEEIEGFIKNNPDVTAENRNAKLIEISARYSDAIDEEYLDHGYKMREKSYVFGCSFAVSFFQRIVDPSSIAPTERELIMQPFSAEPGHFWSKADIEGSVVPANASFRKAFGE